MTQLIIFKINIKEIFLKYLEEKKKKNFLTKNS